MKPLREELEAKLLGLDIHGFEAMGAACRVLEEHGVLRVQVNKTGMARYSIGDMVAVVHVMHALPHGDVTIAANKIIERFEKRSGS